MSENSNNNAQRVAGDQAADQTTGESGLFDSHPPAVKWPTDPRVALEPLVNPLLGVAAAQPDTGHRGIDIFSDDLAHLDSGSNAGSDVVLVPSENDSASSSGGETPLQSQPGSPAVSRCPSEDPNQPGDGDGDGTGQDQAMPDLEVDQDAQDQNGDGADGDEEMQDVEPNEPESDDFGTARTGWIFEESKDEQERIRRREELIYFDRSTAPAELQAKIDRLDEDTIPQVISIGTAKDENRTKIEVSTKDIFAFRGSDINTRVLPQGLDRGQRANTVLEFSRHGSVGKHLEISLAAAQAKDTDEAPAQNQRGGKRKASQPAVDSAPKPEPPRDEIVKAKFHLDTQTPHIEITTVDPDTDNVISTRIWAYEFAWGVAAPWIGFNIARVDPSERDEQDQTDATKQAILTMAELNKTAVVRCTIALTGPRQRVWHGISDESLADIRANPDNMSTRDKLICRLDGSALFALYFSTNSSAGMLAKWTEKLAKYFRDLLMLSKKYGNFWYYRGQCYEDSDCQDPKAIEYAKMPETKFVVPRCLLKRYSAVKVLKPNGQTVYERLRYCGWAPLEFPTSYEDRNEAAFFLKLGVTQERDTQRQGLDELVQSKGYKHFRGRFHCVNDDPFQYSVEIYLEKASEMESRGIKVPTPGTRIEIFVDRHGNNPPRKHNLLKLRGSVVYDAQETDASFVCVVDSRLDLKCADTGSDFAVFIDYIIDDLPYERQIAAIADLQMQPADHKGPDGLGLIFGCKGKSKNTAVIKQKTSPADLVKFKATLENDFSKAPNDTQMTALIHTTQSETGSTAIIGPPGTGKTFTVVKGARAHLAVDRRTAMIAPTNSAVENLVEVFKKQNDALPEKERLQDHQWCIFRGGQSTPDGALGLKRRQTAAEREHNKRNNKYLDHLRDAQLRDKAPRYHQTFGYKLLERIKVWESDATYDGPGPNDDQLHTWSTQYLVNKERLPFMPAEEAEKASDDLINLEYWLSLAYLKELRCVFTTLSTSAHPLMLESGHWHEVIIDEAARETRAGIATALGAFNGRVDHFTWSGDYMQGEGIIIGKDSNVAYKLLSRNVFQEVADTKVKKSEDATNMDVFTLGTCYRMTQHLIQWSSNTCYGGVVKSHETAATYNSPLRKMLKDYWARRLRSSFRGSYEDIGIDAIGKAEQPAGTTTWYNTREAEVIAWTIKDMLLFGIPKEAFIVITNYTGQIPEIKKFLRKVFKGQEALKTEDIERITVALGTTSKVQGHEADIAFYSMVIGDGTPQLQQENKKLGLAFVANVKNFNVSITRQRVARYVVGSWKLFAQANIDKHAIIHTHGEFFNFVRQLCDADFVLSEEETKLWMDGKQPNDRDAFRTKLLAPAKHEGTPVSERGRGQGHLQNLVSRPAATGLGKGIFNTTAPSSGNFTGDRSTQGALQEPVVQPPPAKKTKSKGVKHRTKREQGGNNGGAGGAGGAAAAT